MPKYLYILWFLLLVSCKNKQKTTSEKSQLNFPFNQDRINWAGIEKQDDALKARFIKSFPVEFKNEYGAYDNEFSKDGFDNLDSLKQALHVCDINGDGINDLIFTGNSGGEPFETVFILNTTNGFRVILKSFQNLVKLDIKDNKIANIYIEDPGCCADYIDFNKIYTMDYSNNQAKPNLVYLTANYIRTVFPKKYFDEPIPFEVLNNGYKMRNEPVIDDTTKSMSTPEEGRIGNILGELNKGTKGSALASETDKTGRVWWFVDIDSKAKIAKSIVYEQEERTSKSGKLGWITSRYVKKLN